MTGSVALITACLLLAGCSSKSSIPARGSYHEATWTVKRGDTLWRVAHASGSSVKALARLNGLSAPYTLEVGQKLRLKGSAAASSAKSTSRKTSGASRSSVAKAAPPPVGSRCWRWPAQGKVVIPFSSAQGGNKGIDIAAQRGAPVYAAGAGKVVYAGNRLRGYGNLILLKHGEDYITAYGHNERILVTEGQQVKAGQQIATMGSSGASQVGLHFQIRYRATAIDPQRYLPPSC